MFRTNTNNPSNFQASFRYDIGKIYRIWFSKDPNVFLGMENELRFIRLRKNNPTAKLTFIYSSVCLNTTAKNRLEKFCRQYQIASVDFDTFIPTLLSSDSDKQMYALAKEEIRRTLNNTYGNLAAASDCVRILQSVIEQFGMYIDHDVECSLESLRTKTIEIRSPVLMNAEMLGFSEKSYMLSPNTDFLAFAMDKENPAKLCTEAALSVRYIQREIIKNYKTPLHIDTILNVQEAKPSTKILFNYIYNDFLKMFPRNSSIFDFRQFLTTLSVRGQSEDAKTKLRDTLFLQSVICVSGPAVYSSVYRQLLPPNTTRIPMLVTDNAAWHPYLDMFRKSSLGFYELLSDCVQSNNSVIRTLLTEEKLEDTCDKSWTAEGEDAKKSREEEILKAGGTVLKFWRRQHPAKPLHPFIVRHYEGDVNYDGADFKAKGLKK